MRLCDPFVLLAAEEAVAGRFPLPSKVAELWDNLPKNENGEIERLTCWDLIFADVKLVMMVGKSNKAKGYALLQSMKHRNALDLNNDSSISSYEFRRIADPAVMAAAEADVASSSSPLALKVAEIWSTVPQNDRGEIEYRACWELILSDSELAVLVGDYDEAKGAAMLAAMQRTKLLVANADGWLNFSEFWRLTDPSVIGAAEGAIFVEVISAKDETEDEDEDEDEDGGFEAVAADASDERAWQSENYFSATLPKPMGVVFSENSPEVRAEWSKFVL
jgi:hypothetical protein